MRIHTFIFLFFISWSLPAQFTDLNLTNTSFWDHETQQPILFLNDSTYLYGHDFQIKQVNHLYTDTSNLSLMKVAHINGKTYLYDSAGGVVVSYSNQKFQRHDQSFSHKNQYDSIHFTYNGSIYILGGYGLFTTKNILIKYNFIDREWSLVTTFGDVPEYITSQFFSVKNNQLYFINLGDYHVTHDTNLEVYKLDLENLTFENLGNTSHEALTIKHPFVKINQLDDGRLLYIEGVDKNFMIDFTNNSFSRIATKANYHPAFNILTYSPATSMYQIKNQTYGTNQLKYEEVSRSDLEYNILDTQALYQETGLQIKEVSTYGIFLLLLLGIGALSHKWYKKYNKLSIYISTSRIHYKGYWINDFTKEEYQLLSYLAQQKSYIPLSNLMQELKYDGSYDALKKKRKMLISQIQEKLRPHLGGNVEEFFIIINSKNDKRYKLIKLNPNLIIVKN
ncbi:hypothetical protein [Nonlabens sp.]|uniref:hypothetical protein n=1 Tax=Nonlabens sp. TaxID=1888209 RepID=UPI0025CCB7B8|nr:hypothetical protein [Nonlabens sp.]